MDTTTTIDFDEEKRAGSYTLADARFGPKNGVHLNTHGYDSRRASGYFWTDRIFCVGGADLGG